MALDVGVTITEYKQQLKSLGYAASTIEGYRKNLDLFKRYLQSHDIAGLREVTHQVICDYQEKVMAEPIAMESKALKIRPVKRLFEYLVSTHRLLINPTEGIVETSRRNRKIGTVLTVAEVRRLFKQPNLSLRTGIRDRAIMEVLYSCGIRLDELLNLQVYHVDFKDKVLYIRKGKGKKQRVVPLGKNARKYLKEYLEKIRPWYARKNPKERKLFLNQSGLPMTAVNVRVNLRKYRDEAGIKKSASPHTFRRSCATHLLQNGADIRYIQQLLGHRHLKTTQAYTKVMPLEVKQTHNKTHPGIRGPSFAARATEGKQKKDKS
ncbi:Site-specific tyrosine recombinase XerD, partial [Olavius sp. associated proteobacterium Delta 1]